MNIIFDLDGTLIHSKPRLYHLFQHLAPSSTLSYEQYWAFKENKFSNEMILAQELGYDPIQTAHFVTQWMRLIETPEFLKWDSNFEGIHAALTDLAAEADLHVCTARQLREPVITQLTQLGLLSYFKTVLATELKSSKEALIAAHIPTLTHQDWILGDTGNDILVGRALKINTCAVLTGFQTQSTLQPYGPDLILPSVTDFKVTSTDTAPRVL